MISRGDAYVDCHCGDLPEVLQGFAGVEVTGVESVDGAAVDLANCFDVERIIAESPTGAVGPRTTTATAARAGIPAVLIEFGGRGQWAEDEVDRQLTGLLVVARLGIRRVMMRRRPGRRLRRRLRRPLWPRAGRPARPALPVYEVAADVIAEVGGLWFPAVSPGDAVTVGTMLGTVQDIFGNTIAAVIAPADGVYVYGLASLAVRPGDYLACLVRPAS